MERLSWAGWAMIFWGMACSSRPSVGPVLDSAENTKDTGLQVDTGGPGFVPPTMIHGFFGPMLLDPVEHDFDDPQTLVDMGFDTVGLAQYLLLGPEGIQMKMWSDDEIREIVSGFREVGLGVSLTLSMGYTPTGSEDDWLWATNLPSHGVDPEPLMQTLTEYMVDLVPLARELGIYQLSVNEADLFLHETGADGRPDFSKVSAWGQTHRAAMQAAGWGLDDTEQLVWKTGYGYVPFSETSPVTAIELDFTGYTAAGLSLTPSDQSWVADPETYAVQYRAMVDRSLAHLNDALPEGETWPLVTEFGAWGCECGFWNVDDPSECDRYWSEAHIQVVFSTVFEAVVNWNSMKERDYRGVFVMDSPTDSMQFGLNHSLAVQETIQAGLSSLD